MPRRDAIRNIDRILDSAIVSLARDPTATLSDIADASELHRATLHRHFTSRDELLRALFARAAAEAEAAYWAARPAEGDFDDALRRVLAAALPMWDRYRVLVLADNPDIAAHRTQAMRPIQALLRHGRATGAVRKDLSARWALLAFRGVVGAAAEAVAEGAMSTEQASRAAATTLLHGLSAT